VAFSMFEFLGEYLKFIQLALLSIVVIYFYISQEMKIYTKPIGLLVGAGFSNLLDRFIHGGVVDYIYWHCFFNFAIFNLADILINISVALIFYIHFRKK